MNLKKLNEELKNFLNESEEYTFADWFGKDLTGRTYEGGFYCSDNKLTSLKGAPEKVSGHFYCVHTNLTTLEGAPKYVGEDFDCSYNKLTSLEGSPKEVGGDFSCSNNKLTSLEGSPKEVNGNFYCNHNKLTTLEGIGKVGGEIYWEKQNLNSKDKDDKGKRKVAEMDVIWIPRHKDDGKDEDRCDFYEEPNGTFSFQSDLEAGDSYKTFKDAVKAAKEQFRDFDDEMYRSVRFSKPNYDPEMYEGSI